MLAGGERLELRPLPGGTAFVKTPRLDVTGLCRVAAYALRVSSSSGMGTGSFYSPRCPSMRWCTCLGAVAH